MGKEGGPKSFGRNNFSSYATVIIIPTGALNVLTPVLKTKVIDCPEVILDGVVTVRSVPIVVYPLPVFHVTVTVYVVLAEADEVMVRVNEYCQSPTTVAVVTVPPFVQAAGSDVAVAAL